MNAALALIYTLLDLYSWVIIIYVILSWLVNFRVINTYNRFVQIIWDTLVRLVEPVTSRIRRVLPAMGGLDLSPLLLLLAIFFIQRLMRDTFGYQITSL